MMQLKEAHKASHCDSAYRYVSEALFDRTIEPICKSSSLIMKAAYTIESIKSFKIGSPFYISNETLPTHVEMNSPPESFALLITEAVEVSSLGWRYYSDSKSKYGWLLETTQHTVEEICRTERDTKTSSNNQILCSDALKLSTISFAIQLGLEPHIQIFYLKSYNAIMGAVTIWMDNDTAESIVVQGLWTKRLSVTHVLTISQKSISTNDGATNMDSYVFPSLSEGAHVLHFNLAQFKNKQFKFKLLGITTC